VNIWLSVLNEMQETANTAVPATDGTPEMTPVGDMLKPAGKAPAVSDQVAVDAAPVVRVNE
jgi:hypothetical protein